MSLEQHARDELNRAGLFDQDSDYGGMLGDAVMELITVFAKQGHSGFSAGIAATLFGTLARQEPLSPLTGDDDEWNEVGTGVWQNRRCSTVFKKADGSAYNIDGIVFRDPNGATFTSSDSRVAVRFPYTPKTEIRDVSDAAETDEPSHD